MSLHRDIAAAINRHSRENVSNTPDYILAEYMLICLAAFEKATEQTKAWHGTLPAAASGPGNTLVSGPAKPDSL